MDGVWRHWVRLLALAALLPVLCDGRAGTVAAPLPPEDDSRRSFSGSVLLPELVAQLLSMLQEPFEVLDLSLPMVSLGLLDVQDMSKTPLLRQWLYNHIVATGTDSTENGGDSAQTMIYVGLEDGRFLGYYGPEGRSAYTARAASGEAADTDWAPYATLAAVNECVSSGQSCRDLADGRVVATACTSSHPRDHFPSCTTAHCLVTATSQPEPFAQSVAACTALGSAYTWQVGTCCTASCCDGDIRGYYSTSIAAVGQPTHFVAWIPYDHRARPWYVGAKQAWIANSSFSTGWSSVYEFSTSSAIGITVTGVAARDGVFRGVFAIDYELGGINALLNRSLARSGVQAAETGWAYIVERANGKLLGATSGDALYSNARAGSFTEKRLDAIGCTHNSIAASAKFLAEQGWPGLFHRSHQQWEFQSRIFHGPKNQLEWLVVVGQDTKCSTETEIWNSLAGRCELCSAGKEPSITSTGIDECVECSVGRAGSNGQCVACPDGKMPTDDRSACASCTGDRVGVGGNCERSCLFFVLPNEAKDGCKFWPSKASLLLVALLSAVCLWCAAYKYRQAKRIRAMDLGRYEIDLGPPIHKSQTTLVVFATDFLRQKRRVCLKKVTDLEQFKKEISGRFVSSGQMLDRTAMIKLLAWHTPLGQDIELPDGTQAQEIQRSPSGVRYPYVLVMEIGERSLQDAVARERIAGFHLMEIREIMRCVAACLQTLHEGGLCHGDLKRKNVIQLRDSDSSGVSKWVLCDMDGATRIGSELDPRAKYSTAYSPPELACYKFANGPPVVMNPSFDVWSFGIVLFEMCSGQNLLMMDLNDDLINRNDQVRLTTWFCVDSEQARTELLRKGTITRDSHKNRTMSDEELEPIFDTSAKELAAGFGPELATELERKQVIEDAKDLVRWCLNGRASARPSIAEILDHSFLKPQTFAKTVQSQAKDFRVATSDSHVRSTSTRRSLLNAITLARPPQYFAFLSHAQSDSSGLVNTLYYAFAELGLYNWLDMRQDEITLQSMRDGVVNSNIFMLTLSERVLSSWYCQQEILCAIEHDKPFQIVVEVEPRFRPFDLKSWKGSRSDALSHPEGCSDSDDGRQYSVKNHAGEVEMHTVRVARDPNHSWQCQHSDETLTKLVCDKIDEGLLQAVAFRRRDFEQQAMVEELCRRNGVCLPCASEAADFRHGTHVETNETARGDSHLPGAQHVIFVIYNENTAQKIFRDLQAGLDERSLQGRVRLSCCSQEHLDRWSSEIDTAHKVLLLLSAGVLEKNCLVKQLEHVLLTDDSDNRDRVIMLCGEDWKFGNESQLKAPPVVRTCIESHEALSFRPRDLTGKDWLRHEFPTMMTRVLDMLDLIDGVDDSHNSARTTSDGAGLQRSKSKQSWDPVRTRRSRSTRIIPQAAQSPEARPMKLPALTPSGSSERYLETTSAPTVANDGASTDNDSSFLLPGSAL